MSCRLIPCLAASLALHLSLILPDAIQGVGSPPPSVLYASLRVPPASIVPEDDERLLKNTLDSRPNQPVARLPASTAPSRALRSEERKAGKRVVDKAQRKLSQYLFYPPEAIARGLEGETRLLLTFDDNGRINEVSVAASSGHAILDQAAVRAARAMGRINWSQARELLLPVVFRLE